MKEFSLSPAQERLWFLHRYDPADPGYNVNIVHRVTGPVDGGVLALALGDLQARHEALRTRFPEREGKPYGLVEPPSAVPVELLELSEEEALHAVAERTNAPFDLAAGPPIRATLIGLGTGDHVLCLVLHHIVADGWSLNILLAELGACYAARRDGRAPDLPPLPVPPAAPEPGGPYGGDGDGDRDADGDLAYWARRLAGAPVLDLPTDLSRPAERDSRGSEVVFTVPAPLAAALTDLARTQRCTPFTVLLTAYQALLGRLTGQRDLVIGSPAAGRDRPELEPLVGLFTNTLVLRGDLSGDPPFTELLRRTRRTLLEAMSRQEVPFERLLATLDVGRDLSRTPLFQTVVTLHSNAAGYDEADTFAGMPSAAFPHGWARAKVDLTLDMWQRPDGILATFMYSTDLFEAATVRRFADRFLTLLRSVADGPHLRLSELEVLPEPERALLAAGNATAAEVGPETVVDLVRRRIRATPAAPAVVCGARRVTYAELGARMEEVAVRLRAAGAGPGSLVAVCAGRSDLTVAGLLGVLATGAAYVPVDPDYPAARIEHMLADSGTAIVLADEESRERLPASVTVVPLDARDPAAPGGPASPSAASHDGPQAADPAYVIYTSGSTGRPKGVVVTHGALSNFLAGMAALLDPSPRDVWLWLTSLSFDISALELYLPLVHGGSLVVADARTARDGAALARLVGAGGVTHIQATPSGWRMLLAGDAGTADVVGLVGGEALPLSLAAELRPRVRRLVNMYGPTETTIWSTAWEVPRDPREVLIGRPIANTQVYVLDPDDRQAPIGVPGELVIGGAGLARGYLGRPALTAERFVPDPWGPPGSRLYRTGDRVRLRPDGTLEFLGRADRQVKLRGHRIEPGEIEAVLESCPGVAQAAVVVRDDRLAAYLVSAGTADPSGTGSQNVDPHGVDLQSIDPHGVDPREYAAGLLPAVMVPSTFTWLSALPLTPNGKVDRDALPDPALPAGGRGGPPTGASQLRVAGLFSQVLGAREVGADDDFFTLGGHSLLAVKVIAALEAELGVEVPIPVLFGNPTVAGLAAALDDLTGRAASGDPGDSGGRLASPPVPRPAGTAPPLSRAQERLWFLHRLDPDDASYTMFLVRRLSGPLDPAALGEAFTALVERHESLRTRFPDRDGQPLAVVEPAAATVLTHLDVPGGTPEETEAAARRIVAEWTNAPFDLAAAPPVRAGLLRLGPAEHVLCVVFHHIIGDGWSLNVLLDDLARLYSARVAGLPALPPLPLQYGDVALWQRGRDESAALAHWRERLARPPVLDLPTDRPRGQARRGAFHPFRLPEEVVSRLEEIGRERGATLFMVLLAAYQVLLARHTGQDDLLVGSPYAGRDRPEFEPIVGCFTTMLVLRGDLSGDPAFTELLGRTRRDVLDALTHQEVPLERLATELGVQRDLTRTPLFETMAVLHNQGGRPADFGDVRAGLFDTGYAQAKLDLAFEAWREADGLSMVLGYDAALFDPGTVAGFASGLQSLLRGVAAHPERPVSLLPLSAEADREALTGLAQGPADDRTDLVPALIAASAPGAVAVERGGRELTYAELDRRVTRLADRLRETGAGPGTVVAVRAERSIGTLVAILAAWRAGAAYLPVDPATPDARRAHLLADSRAVALVTGSDETEAVEVVGPAGVVGPAVFEPAVFEPAVFEPAVGARGSGDDGVPEPGERATQSGGRVAQPGERATQPGDAAYLIYTSGSTGVPKGVVVEHRSLAARVRWMVREYGLRPGDRVVQFASLGFDAHAEEIHPTLSAGATLVLLPGGPETLPDFLATPEGRRVTVLDLPTAYWHRLVEVIDEVTWPDTLRLVILGGEQLYGSAVRRWREHFGDRVRLVNTYGPTEATIIATAAEATGEERPPIGRPISATSVRLLDSHGEPVPRGAAGELCVGGDGVARGYLGRPALTAERFVPDPWGPPGSRLYRTGDRARWRADGQLEFLGRMDDQVKVRGFRVEPGEIEALLTGHPRVAQAAVLAHGETLAAYVVPSPGPEAGAGAASPASQVSQAPPVDEAELRRHLAASLPPYMVPTFWTTVAALPMTVNGKVDRAALPRPEARATVYVAPRSDAEELVAEVWSEVLGRDRIGAFDDFFALGGHSLLATRVTARLRTAVEVQVPLKTLFVRRTVAELAEAVEELIAAEVDELSDDEVTARLAAGEAVR
ncbi:non-ribosomal peptide synthetase [Planobispora siamensis]|uniref:Non-ribosomal peptide synthetase n=1 Tax=Planobispora siamensis TaxID=936338 RepID=A0A8J3SD93_9ACTN|nr:non-ribosomal peptide synthetase [Planobispora siamensis]GIH92272.1 non-ribosomal peptide synthetase [Planobispora siamensis]